MLDTMCVSVGLLFCISCHISCLSPARLSRLPGPVSLMGFGWSEGGCREEGGQ